MHGSKESKIPAIVDEKSFKLLKKSEHVINGGTREDSNPVIARKYFCKVIVSIFA